MPEHTFKILLIGDTGSGKTAALRKFTEDAFSSTYMTTIGVDFAVKNVQIGGQVVKLQIWDTAGLERFRAVTNSYYRGAQGVAIVFDLTDRETFDNVKRWHREVERYAAEDCPMLMIGTKSDLEKYRQVDSNDAEDLAKELNLGYFETSSKTGEGIHAFFEAMVEKILQAKKANDVNGPSMTTRVKGTQGKSPAGQSNSKTCVIH